MTLTLLALTLLAAIWVFPHIWLYLVKDHVQVEMKFKPRIVGVGDTVQIHCTLKNTSRLPCPFVEIAMQLPDGLSMIKSREERDVRFATHLARRQEMEMIISCYAVKRGMQRLQNYPVYVKMNEGLGLKILALSKAQKAHLTVMPALLEDHRKPPLLTALTGRIERFHWIHQDESMLRGIREYQPGDPLKYISWQASAAHGTLMTRQFSASTEATVCLLLNAQMFSEYWSGTRHQEFNRLCEMVAGYALELQSHGFQLHFATNAILQSNPSQTYFRSQTANSIRAFLGELEPYATRDFLTLWDEYTSKAPTDETAIVFTSFQGEGWEFEMNRETAMGRNIEIILGPDPLVAESAESRPNNPAKIAFEQSAHERSEHERSEHEQSEHEQSEHEQSTSHEQNVSEKSSPKGSVSV